MFRSKLLRLLAAFLGFALLAAACGDDDDTGTTEDTSSETTEATDDGADEGTDEGDDMGDMEDGGDEMASSAEACDADSIVAMVEGGEPEGTLEGMTDDPVGTAASNNPVLTTLVTAVDAAGLVDTLNAAEEITVFAPTDCAFANLDEATLQAALDDPEGLLTTVLTFHVVAGTYTADDLAGVTELETLSGEVLTIDGTALNGGASNVVVPNIETANATVHLIDAVMLPPSVTG